MSRVVDTPVFLVGSERSGTTLLRLMLDHHPRIALHFESDFLVARISDAGAFPTPDAYRAWLRTDRAFQHGGFRIDECLDFPGLVNDFLRQKQARDGKELVGATVHHQFRRLVHVWPKARYIYLLRDGRDVANSAMRMGWAGNVYVAADVWLEAEEERDAALARVDAGRWLEVRYENLICDTRTELERICAFLGVEYSERMLDYVRTSTYEAPDPSLSHQWKRVLSRAQVRLLEERLGERLRLRGYELSDNPQLSLSPLARRWLRLHSRIGAYAFRLHRYGAALTLQETLSRRLGLERLNQAAMARINRITDSYMK